ncbi:MAG TPA: hypothetical protein VG755_00475 [Nannocystaceae bacterium]|nr:hypothetical protein [Nannocystaceae bacterium]
MVLAKALPAEAGVPGPAAWLDLRDAASAVRLAVQMLNGPLAPWNEPDESRVREVMGALDQATKKLCQLVTTLQPSANDRPLAIVPRVDPIEIAPVEPPPEPIASTTEPKPSRVRARVPKRPDAPPATDVDALLHQLELTVLTRSDPPVLLSVQAKPGLVAAIDPSTLLQLLLRLVEDAAALGPAPDTTVTLRAWLDPIEELGDEMEIVVEVRPDPRAPAAGHAWLDGALAPPPGAALGSRVHGGQHCARLRVPTRAPA